jgi:hypothetical protein
MSDKTGKISSERILRGQLRFWDLLPDARNTSDTQNTSRIPDMSEIELKSKNITQKLANDA